MTNEAISATPLPDEAGWFLFHRHDCHGPFTRTQVVQLIMAKRIDASWMVMKDGWQEWRSLVDCLNELSNDEATRKSKQARESERRIGAPRIPIRATVKATNDHTTTHGQASNISVSGIFVSTSETALRLGEEVKLTVHSPELKDTFDVRAEVMRYNANRRSAVGYGMRFIDLSNTVVVDIARIVGYRPAQEFGEVYSLPFNKPPKV